MYEIRPPTHFKVEMILSLDYLMILSALLNWPWVYVLFLTVVMSVSLTGKKEKSEVKGST